MTENVCTQKILKLLAKAESTTPEEAEALVEKAQELMQRYSITEAAIAHAKGEKSKPQQIVRKRFHFEGRFARAHVVLVGIVAGAGGMRSVQRRARSEASGHWNAVDVDIVGFETDVDNAELLITSLLIQSAQAANAYGKTWKLDNPHTNANTLTAEKVSFVIGYASGIGSKLRAARKRAETEVKAERGERSVALAIVDKKKQVDEWMDHTYGKLRSTRGPSARTSSYQRGSVAGQNANLGGTGIQGARGALTR